MASGSRPLIDLTSSPLPAARRNVDLTRGLPDAPAAAPDMRQMPLSSPKPDLGSVPAAPPAPERPGPTATAPAPAKLPNAGPTKDAAVSDAEVLKNGIALPPIEAPQAVHEIIEAGNSIARTPYLWGGRHGKWLALRPLIFVGAISYPLYLVHVVLGFAVIRWSIALGWSTLAGVIAAGISCLVVATLLHYFVELPGGRRVRATLTRRPPEVALRVRL